MIKSLQECHDAGIPAANVFSAGSTKVSATGEPPLHDAVAAYARKTGMRIIGPNTEGCYNVAAAIAANFNPAVANENGSGSRDLAGRKGLAIVSHSGGGLAFRLYMRARDMPIPVPRRAHRCLQRWALS